MLLNCTFKSAQSGTFYVYFIIIKHLKNDFQVSHMKAEEVALVTQLTLVETLWTEELKVLQASAEILTRLRTASTERSQGPSLSSCGGGAS